MAWKVTLVPEAEAELLTLPADMRSRFVHIAEMLEEFGPQRAGMLMCAPWRANCGKFA